MSKVVLITGASAGIGKATADRLDTAGWTVVGASRRGSASVPWHSLVMDVDSDEEVSDGVAQVIERHKGIDALVACAGWGLAGAVEQTPIRDAKAQFETNFWGVVRCVQATLPAMRATGAGRLVLVSSLGGIVGIPFQAFYSASKFALEGYGEALNWEVSRYGVTVTLVEPGNIKTEFTAARRCVEVAADDETYKRALDRAIKVMERDEGNGAPVESVAAAIEKVLNSKTPPRRVTVGKTGERAGTFAKRLLPNRLFEAAAKSVLGV